LILTLTLAFGVRLQAQPTILQQPLSLLDQLLGSTVSVCVQAQSSATTNLQYQWLRNGVRIPGATNACLPLNGLQAIDCGAFSVLVDDGVGVAVSEPADVTVSGLNLLQGIDQLIDALDLGTNGVIRSYNIDAVKQPGTPELVPGDPGGSEVWFQWTVPLLQASGIVTFSTLGSDFDTAMGVYTGSEPGNLISVPSAINDDDDAGYLNSQVTFYAVKGTTYLIGVDGFYGEQGNIVLGWHLYPNSPKLPNATNTLRAITATDGATVTLSSPWPGNNCDWLLNGAVFATNTNVLIITNLGQDTVGSYVGRFTTKDGIAISAEPTEVQINTTQDGGASTNSIAWAKFLTSANSPFIQSTGPGQNRVMKLSGGGDSGGFSSAQTFNTTGNPDQPGEPTVCGQNGGHPGWYSYVTPASGSLVINTAGSTFNTVLGVFTGPGDSFTTLTNIGCGYTTNYHVNGQPSVYLPTVPAGQTNYIVVQGQNGASGVVRLNINLGVPISILSAPQDQSAGPGTNVNLAVSTSGSGPMSYAWLFNGNYLPGATDRTLTINNMQPFNAGTYSVTVSNAVSVVTTQAVVSYGLPITISAPPQSQSAGQGTNVSLGVSLNGSGPISYTWQFDGTNLDDETNATLTITNMQASDAGTYTVVASNCISMATAQAVVSYGIPISISVPPLSQFAGPGTNVNLGVSLAGSGPISYTWQFDGANLGGETNATLTIPNMQASNAGTYTVVASNCVSVASAQAMVSYAVAPTIISQPLSQTVASNSTATLTVSATGSPAPTYQWFLNGAPTGANNNTLSIQGFQSTNQGRYTVIVSNALGAVTSTPALLLLNGPARISSCRLCNEGFSLQIAGPAGANYIIECSSDLVNWTPLCTNSAPNGILEFTDTNAANLTNCFYQVITNSP